MCSLTTAKNFRSAFGRNLAKRCQTSGLQGNDSFFQQFCVCNVARLDHYQPLFGKGARTLSRELTGKNVHGTREGGGNRVNVSCNQHLTNLHSSFMLGLLYFEQCLICSCKVINCFLCLFTHRPSIYSFSQSVRPFVICVNVVNIPDRASGKMRCISLEETRSSFYEALLI